MKVSKWPLPAARLIQQRAGAGGRGDLDSEEEGRTMDDSYYPHNLVCVANQIEMIVRLLVCVVKASFEDFWVYTVAPKERPADISSVAGHLCNAGGSTGK